MEDNTAPLFPQKLPDPGVPLTPPARHDAPGTSKMAATLIRPAATSQRGVLLNHFVQDATYRGGQGMTDEEGQSVTGLAPNSYRPRRGELVRLGWLTPSNKLRMTHARHLARVYWLSAAACSELGIADEWRYQ